MAARFSGPGLPFEGLATHTPNGARWTNTVVTLPDELDTPKHWRKPARIFVNSMSDLFHASVPLEFIQQIFQTMVDCPRHTFQVLTKRSERLAEIAAQLPWPENVWAGVSVESADYLYRLDHLRQVPAHVRWVSFEPLLGPIANPDLSQIHWVVVGGESGSDFRPMDVEWARDLRDACLTQGVDFFFKQFSGIHPSKLGYELDGIHWDNYPA
jgi:protein gp37